MQVDQRSGLVRAFLAFALLGWAQLAVAHPVPFSYLDLYLTPTGMRGELIIHDYDAAHELGLSAPQLLLDPSVATHYREALTRIVASRLRITADGDPAVPAWGPMEVLADRQSLRLSFDVGQRALGSVEIDAVLFPYDANHQSFINIYEAGQLKHQAIIDARQPTFRYYAGGLQGRWAVVRTFVQAGIRHILIGPDHILFLLGLLLLGGSLWRLSTIVTAFTLGHSITLSLAALGLVRIAPSLVEPAIALSIIVVGVDNLLVGRQRSRATAQMAPSMNVTRDLRPWLAAGFGLIHGLGFASVLLEFGLPREALGWSLAAFNLGVEIGQLLIVVVMAALLALLRRSSKVLAQRCVRVASVVVVVAGVYWFVQRIWFNAAS